MAKSGPGVAESDRVSVRMNYSKGRSGVTVLGDDISINPDLWVSIKLFSFAPVSAEVSEPRGVFSGGAASLSPMWHLWL